LRPSVMSGTRRRQRWACPTLKAPIGLVGDPKLIDLLIGQGIGVEKQSMSTW
jgi:hypothetical protein